MTVLHAISRRNAARLITGAALLPPLPPSPYALTPADTAFLDDMQRRATLFFVEQADPATGQVLDRARHKNSTGSLDPRTLSSIAATGFGLTVLCLADNRKYMPSKQIRDRVYRTLDFHANRLKHDHGFFHHFNHVHTGEPARGSEISSIDTSILLCGVLTARAWFKDPQITDLANTIYRRVEWPWMLNGGSTFSMGVRGNRFIPARWDHYCELMMLYLLAIGSPTHPVSPALWNDFSRPRINFKRFNYIGAADPLFVHQYSHAWFDFAGRRDRYADYFQNSVTATQAHKAFCLSLNLGYTEDLWGVSASDWKGGYTAWGGPPLFGPVDGSVVPCATAGSLPFLPEACLRVQRSLQQTFGDKVWGRYGFPDAFHPGAGWYDPDVLGIDLGIGAVMAENLRSGFVWKTFMQNPEAAAAMKAAGFRSP